MAFGFNTNVVVGDRTYHVQTEAARKGCVIETTVYLRGIVFYSRRVQVPENERDELQLELRIRSQHGETVTALKTGALVRE
jgi:hypothetical protein